MVSYVVTGANRGIGFEFVRQLSAKSENIVFALVRSKSKAAKLNNLGRSNIHVLEADLSDRDSLRRAAKDVAAVTEGSLDILINNAVFVDFGREKYGITSYPPEDEDKIGEDLTKSFKINVVGTVDCTNAFLPLLRSESNAATAGEYKKKVITLSSGAGHLEFTRRVGEEGVVPYSLSKAAINMVMLKYALAEKKRANGEEVIFLSLHPGAVDTLDRESMTPKQVEEFQKVNERISAGLKRADPTFKGWETPENSVKMMLNVIEKVGSEESGLFLSRHGNDTQWV